MASASYLSSHFFEMTLGKEYDFEIYSYDSSHLHKVVIKCGSYSMTFDRVKGGVEKKYTIPLTWAKAMPNATSLSGTITLTTYKSDYSTKVGSNKVETTKFNLPTTIKPSVNHEVSEAVDGIAEQFGFLVQGKSMLNIDINSEGAYGSTIKSCKTTVNGITYTGDSFTSRVLNPTMSSDTGNISVTTTVTDSRGRTAEDYSSYTIYKYEKPKINTFTIARCNSDGTLNEEGTFVKVISSAAIKPLNNKNTKVYKLSYKLTREDTWTEIELDNSSYDLTDERIIEGFSIDDTYNFKLEVFDYFYADDPISKSLMLETSEVIMDFLANGRGMAIGKASEDEETLDVGYDNTFLSKDVYVGGNKRYDGQKNIHFNNTGDGNIEHDTKIYGGDGTSDIALGIYDLLHNHRVVYYLDTKKTLELDPLIKLSNFFNAITMVRSSDELTLNSTSETQIPLTQYAKVGSKLSYSGNNIVIGPGVSVVKVTGSVYFHSGFAENDVVHTLVKRNSDIVNMGIKRIKGAYETLAISDKLISVTEGDVIGLYTMNQTEGRGTIGGSTHGTYLTVEVVG